MSQLILHHYKESTFAEKIRLMMGYKGLAYGSVSIPIIMPKPDLIELTGGYRKTPVMQQGAHIFCDTKIIAKQLDRIQPLPSLYPQEYGHQTSVIQEWAEQTLFPAAVGLVFSPQGISHSQGSLKKIDPQQFMADRAELSKGSNLRTMSPQQAADQVYSILCQLEKHFAEARPFYFGKQPTAADFALYHCFWFINNNRGVNSIFKDFAKVQQWMSQMADLGHGEPTPLSSSEAIHIAAQEEPHIESIEFSDINGLKRGDDVTVHATDYGKNKIAGKLILSSDEEIIIERVSDKAGRLMVHFPKAGFEINKL